MIEELNFGDERVMQIDFETLQASADYKERKFEISHHQFLKRIMDMLDAEKIEWKISELYVAEKDIIWPTQREVEWRDDLKTTSSTRGVIIRNMLCKIDLISNGLSDEETSSSIAIGYNRLGVEVTYGTNVHVCSNMNMFGGRKIRSYQEGKLTVNEILNTISGWIANAIEIRRQDLAILARMKEITWHGDFMNEVKFVIGDLNDILLDEDIKDAPLRQARITDLHRALRTINSDCESAGIDPSVYLMYQAATDISTHQAIIENRIANTVDLGNYFMNRYELHDAYLPNEPSPDVQGDELGQRGTLISDANDESLEMIAPEEPTAKRIKKNAEKIEEKEGIKEAEKIVKRTDLDEEQKETAKEVLKKADASTADPDTGEIPEVKKATPKPPKKKPAIQKKMEEDGNKNAPPELDKGTEEAIDDDEIRIV